MYLNDGRLAHLTLSHSLDKLFASSFPVFNLHSFDSTIMSVTTATAEGSRPLVAAIPPIFGLPHFQPMVLPVSDPNGATTEPCVEQQRAPLLQIFFVPVTSPSMMNPIAFNPLLHTQHVFGGVPMPHPQMALRQAQLLSGEISSAVNSTYSTSSSPESAPTIRLPKPAKNSRSPGSRSSPVSLSRSLQDHVPDALADCAWSKVPTSAAIRWQLGPDTAQLKPNYEQHMTKTGLRQREVTVVGTDLEGTVLLGGDKAWQPQTTRCGTRFVRPHPQHAGRRMRTPSVAATILRTARGTGRLQMTWPLVPLASTQKRGEKVTVCYKDIDPGALTLEAWVERTETSASLLNTLSRADRVQRICQLLNKVRAVYVSMQNGNSLLQACEDQDQAESEVDLDAQNAEEYDVDDEENEYGCDASVADSVSVAST